MYNVSTNATTHFMLNTMPHTNKNAQRWCNDRGGHLAYFENIEQQTAVETYYKGLGVLLPSFTPQYWLGLRSNRTSWPDFDWFQRLNAAPSAYSYDHWGGTGKFRQPDNAVGVEYCGVADALLEYDGAWGWNDLNCTIRLPFMCRLDGG